MPKTLPVGHSAVQPDTSSSSVDRESRPLVIRELSSVNPSSETRSILQWSPYNLWQRLAQLLRLGVQLTPEELELTEILESGRAHRLNAEAAEEAVKLAQEKLSQPGCSVTGGVVLLCTTIAAIFGAQRLFAHNQAAPHAGATPPDNGTGMALYPDPEPAFPLPAAAIDSRLPPGIVASPARLLPLVNATCNDIVARLPGIQRDAVAQQIVVPLLRMLDESVFGQPLTAQQQQALSLMVNVLLSTLTTPEHLQLYQMNRTAADNSEITGRFTALAGSACVSIADRTLRLWGMPDGTPFIVDSEGRCRFIRFNQKKMNWEYVQEADNGRYSARNRELIEQQSESLAHLPATTRIEADGSSGLINVTAPQIETLQGVFTFGKFIPSQSNRDTGITGKSAGCAPATSKHVLLRSNYGWEFERPSVKMDEGLKLLLESQNHCTRHAPELPIYRIKNSDGISVDGAGKKFLKKDHQFFNVMESYNFFKKRTGLKLTDYPNAFIEYKNDVMILTRADDIIFALRIDKSKSTSVSPETFYIESEAVLYLKTYALKTAEKPVHALTLRQPGIQETRNHNLVFVIHDDKYVVREFSDTRIQIKHMANLPEGKNDIVLWAAGDILLRVRDENIDIAYKTLPFDYPDTPGNLPVMIETDLNRKLKKNIDDNRASTPSLSREKLIKDDAFSLPLFWLDTQSRHSYFLYNGKYLLATLIGKQSPENIVGASCLKIFGQGDFFNQHKYITTLVEERKDDRIEIKTQESFLAEKLKINQGAVELYIKNAPWRHVAEARTAAELVSAVLASCKFYVAPVGKNNLKKTADLNTASYRKSIVSKLYPARIDETLLSFFRLSDDKKTLNPGELKIQNNIINTINFIKDNILSLLETSLYYNTLSWPVVQTYLNEITGIHSAEFQSEFSVAWRNRVQQMKNSLNDTNIYLVNGRNIHLNQDEKTTAQVAYISPDDGNCYINTHKLPPGDNPQTKLVSVLIQAAAYNSDTTRNFIDIRQSNGIYIPFRDAIETLTTALMHKTLSPDKLKALQEVSRKYMENVPVYRQKIDKLLTPEILAYLATYDPAYRAHLLLNSDVYLTLISLDMYYMLSVTQKATSTVGVWLKAYSEYRLPALANKNEFTVGATSTTKAPDLRYFVHLPDHPQSRYSKPQRTAKQGEYAEADSRSKNKLQDIPESDRNSDTDPVSSRESDRNSDTDPVSSRETEPEIPADNDPGTGQNTGPEDSSDERSRSNSFPELPDIPPPIVPPPVVPPVVVPPAVNPRSPPARPPAVNPHHPITPPAISAGAAGGSVLANVGIGIVAAAPKPPVISERPSIRREANTTATSTTALVSTTAEPPSTAEISTTTQTIITIAPRRRGRKKNRLLRYPQIRVKHNRGMTDADAHDNVFLPEEPAGSGQGIEERVFIPGHGNVTAIELPELKCLGNKDVTTSEILRSIGEAIINPVTANTEAWRDIYYIDIKGGDCPTPEQGRWVVIVAEVVDAVINTAMMLVPGLSTLAVIKNTLGPTLLLIADRLENKNNAQETREYLMDIAQQTLGVMRVEVPTLKGQDMARLLDTKIIKDHGTEKSTTYKRFINKHDGKIHVNVDGKEYPVLITYDEKPTILDNSGRYRLIKFDQQKESWEFTDGTEQLVAEEARDNQNKYRMVLSTLSERPVIKAADHDMFTIKIKDKPETTGVFIGMDFIPARIEKVGNEFVACTTTESVAHEEQRLLVHTRYGWEFERSSVKNDKYIEALLKEKEDSSFDIAQRSFGSIQEADGLSYDSNGNSYIRHNYKYYQVEKSNNILQLTNYPDAEVEFKNNYFALKNDWHMLFALKTKRLSANEEPFRIEKSALRYLREYALKSSASAPERVAPGIYEDADETTIIFVVDNEKFAVSYRAYRVMHIKRNSLNAHLPDIRFWMDKNTWIRIRDEAEEPVVDYTDIIKCRTARSPGAASACVSVTMDSGLHDKLQDEIFNQMTSDSVPDPGILEEIRTHDIPGLYHDFNTGNNYFFFDEQYFNAKIIESTNEQENSTGFPCLKITGRSDFYRYEKQIATIVMVADGNTIKIEDLSVFISQKTKVGTEAATQYNNLSPFIGMEYAELIEKLTTDLMQSENVYVEQPANIPELAKNTMHWETLFDDAKKALFPDQVLKNDDYSIDFYDLTANPDKYNPYVKDAVYFVRKQIKYLHDNIIIHVINALDPGHYNNLVVDDYLIEILKKNENAFLNDIKKSISSRIVKAARELTNRKVKLITAIKKPQNEYSQYEKNTDNVVFIHDADPDNIFINIDMLDVHDNDKNMVFRELTGAILQAVLRSAKASQHIINIPRRNGIFTNIKNALRHAQYAGQKDILTPEESTKMHAVVSRYIINTPIYNGHLSKLDRLPMEWMKFSYMLQHDAGLRAQVILNSDDFLTLITQDLHYLASTAGNDMNILHPWVKRYGIRRGVLSATRNIDTPPDIITTAGIDIGALKYTIDQKEIQGKYYRHNNIYMYEQNKLCFRWREHYFPLDFIGGSSRMIVLGKDDDIRQVYYYDRKSGEIESIQSAGTQPKLFTYYKDLDLYESKTLGSDYSFISKFDNRKKRLVSTEATRILRLPGKISRIEFPRFNLYIPHGAASDVYLVGHGKALKTKYTMPTDAESLFYTVKWQQLIPYKGNAEDFLSGSFHPQEVIASGSKTDDYMIKPFSRMPVNHYHLARKYNKIFIDMFAPSKLSTHLIEPITSVLFDEKINLHLYMCRAAERQDIEGAVGGIVEDMDYLFNAGEQSSRWAFDQQIEGGKVLPDRTIDGLLPLMETEFGGSYELMNNFVHRIIESCLADFHYEIFYGLDVNPEMNNLVPSYIINARTQVLRNIEKAKASIDNAWLKINNDIYKIKIKKYLLDCFGSVSDEILDNIIDRLKVIISRSIDFIDESKSKHYENIAIVSTKHTVNPEDPTEFQSAITDINQREHIDLGFMIPGDVLHRIFIMNDALPPEEIDGKIVDTKEVSQPITISHEITHITVQSSDVFYITVYADRSFVEDAEQLGLEQLNKMLEDGDLYNTGLMSYYIPNLSKYIGLKKTLTDKEAVSLIQNSQYRKIDLILNNADSLALFITKIAEIDVSGKGKRSVNNNNQEYTYQYLSLITGSVKMHYINNVSS